MNITPEKIAKVYNRKGYDLFEDDSKNYNLNLIGIRTKSQIPNSFDDWFLVLWKFHGWNILKFKATTDPGLYWLRTPINDLGTAVVKEGRYPGLWKVGLHKGYKALQQKAPVTVIRDFNKDNHLDFDGGREETGIFGINGHRASELNESIVVNKWSAGCQVIANPWDFDILMMLADHGAKVWGNSFTYVLLHERDFDNIS